MKANSAFRESSSPNPSSKMSDTPFVFHGTGAVQSHVVPASGNYVIEAWGAQGGVGGGEGGKGARIKGTFQLKEGEQL